MTNPAYVSAQLMSDLYNAIGREDLGEDAKMLLATLIDDIRREQDHLGRAENLVRQAVLSLKSTEAAARGKLDGINNRKVKV